MLVVDPCIFLVSQRMPHLEARLRAEVGPEFGFDLNQIRGHYEHRRSLRARLTSLQSGKLVLLTANHRYGTHGHVFAFARVLEGTRRCRACATMTSPTSALSGFAFADEISVIACNFNHHPSTFAIDCSGLAGVFGASDEPANIANRCVLLWNVRLCERYMSLTVFPESCAYQSLPRFDLLGPKRITKRLDRILVLCISLGI